MCRNIFQGNSFEHKFLGSEGDIMSFETILVIVSRSTCFFQIGNPFFTMKMAEQFSSIYLVTLWLKITPRGYKTQFKVILLFSTKNPVLTPDKKGVDVTFRYVIIYGGQQIPRGQRSFQGQLVFFKKLPHFYIPELKIAKNVRRCSIKN